MSDGLKAGINNVPMIVSALGGVGTRLDATMTIAAIAMHLMCMHLDDIQYGFAEIPNRKPV